MDTTLRRLVAMVVVLASATIAAAPAEASSDALLKLLKILRDRGSITQQEFDELTEAAAPTDQPAPTTAIPPPAVAPPVPASRAAVASDVRPQKWYDRLGVRGYTQFRFADVLSEQGPELEVPADRSVNANESFIIRRGRVVLSGDVSDQLYIYIQPDLQASTGASDYSLQIRDAYADIAFDAAKVWRVRVGQSKVPFGFVNMQSSQNRAPFERPDALNSAVETERDLGAYLMWASPDARRRFRDLVSQGLKGSGDYGVFTAGVYAGQGPNRSDQNGQPHVLLRASYPFKLASGQFLELGVQAYRGRFVSPTQAITFGGAPVTPMLPQDGVTDERVAVTAVWYPQPFGVEAEWNVGRGPELSEDYSRITSKSLQGGYVQATYRGHEAVAVWLPFVRWNYFDGARKFARNAPRTEVNEVDIGIEFAKWVEVELTAMYTHTFARTKTSTFPYALTRDANRLGLQLQWNY